MRRRPPRPVAGHTGRMRSPARRSARRRPRPGAGPPRYRSRGPRRRPGSRPGPARERLRAARGRRWPGRRSRRGRRRDAPARARRCHPRRHAPGPGARASSTDSPASVTRAPSRCTAATLKTGASRGMNTSQEMPCSIAAWATARPWLPALAVTRPARARGPSAATFESAPRSLKDPVRCRHSHFSASGPPASGASSSEGIVGVCRTSAATAALAASRSRASISRWALSLTVIHGIRWDMSPRVGLAAGLDRDPETVNPPKAKHPRRYAREGAWMSFARLAASPARGPPRRLSACLRLSR